MSFGKKKIILKDQIVSFYQHLFTLTPINTHIILHSGRAATKSTFFAMWHLFRMLYYPNADGLVMAYEYSSIKDKVLSDYRFAADLLEIPKEHIEFHSTENGTTWIKIKNKHGTNTIFFEHGKGGSESLKGRRCNPGNKWLFIHYYELTNFINWSSGEITNNNATFIRNAYGRIKWNEVNKYCRENNLVAPINEKELKKQDWYFKHWEKFLSQEFCVCYEFNTPGSGISNGNWVTESWLVKQRKSPDTYYQFNNYLDMSDKERFIFLKPPLLKEIQNVKDTDPINYNHIYLGKEPYDGDLVYPQINKSIHFGTHENFQPDILIIGVDVGRSDPTVCTLNGVEFRQKDLRVGLGIHRWSHCNRRAEMYKDGVKQVGQHGYRAYDMFQYCDFILEFCQMVHEEYPYAYIYFQMDYANEGKSFYDQMFKFGKPAWLNINRSWEKVLPEDRIDTFNVMFTVPGLCKIYDPILFSAFKNQVYDRKTINGERKRLDDPTKPMLDMDSLDSCEYGILKPMYQELKNRIRQNRGKWESNVKNVI